jgi:hypothetical protein
MERNRLKNYGSILIETRLNENIPQIIVNHLKFLPKEFGFLGFCSEQNKHLFNGYDFKICQIGSIFDYNKLLCTREFWDQIPFDKVLIFQCDSGILRSGIEEFYEYDYVGAPWSRNQLKEEWKINFGGNGGFSWRNVLAMRELAVGNPGMSWPDPEDVVFCQWLKDSNYRIAPFEICSKFSAENIFKLGTFGWHRIHEYLSKQECDLILNQYMGLPAIEE